MNNNDYFSFIDQKVYSLSNLSFWEIIDNFKGLYPIDLLNSLIRLKDNKKIDMQSFMRIISQNDDMKKEYGNHIALSPIPHLLDGDWRFSTEGITFLLEKISSYIPTNGKKISILLIGTPSLFAPLTELYNDALITIWDINAQLHELNNYSINLLDAIPYNKLSPKFDFIIIDPPWYPEYYKRCFQIASKVSSVGALIIGAFPPLFTRPSITDEREELQAFASNMGFGSIHYAPTCVSYLTPPFEKNAFRANKIFSTPNLWRYGDLFTCEFKAEFRHSSEIFFHLPSYNWDEISIGPIRFKFKSSKIPFVSDDELSITSIYKYDDIFPSVSRRFTPDSDINLWTSGNRVFHCNNIPLLVEILNAIKIGSESSFIKLHSNNSSVKKAIEFIKIIISKELHEYGNLTTFSNEGVLKNEFKHS